MEITDAQGAESLTRWRVRPGDLVLADRNDAKANAIAARVAQGVHVLVRIGWNALRWEPRDGTPWSILEAVRAVPDALPGEWWVQIPGTRSRPALPVRIVALRQSRSAGEKTRRKARRHGHTVARETLIATDYVFVLTT